MKGLNVIWGVVMVGIMDKGSGTDGEERKRSLIPLPLVPSVVD